MSDPGKLMHRIFFGAGIQTTPPPPPVQGPTFDKTTITWDDDSGNNTFDFDA